MQTSNAKQNFRSDDPVWVLLAEFSLGDFLSDHDQRQELMAGFLFQTARELGVPPEDIQHLTRTLAGFATEALVRTKQGRLELSERIRVFCQKKMIDDTNSAMPSRPFHTEQGKEQGQVFPDSCANTMGGWGYFVIERGADLPPDSAAILHNCVDLYLYKEGE